MVFLNLIGKNMDINQSIIPVDQLLRGIFLFIIAVSGNFIAELLSCNTQKLLTTNMYIKHFIGLLIIYFAIGFTNSEKAVHPFLTLFNSLIVYILFILFSKMNLYFTVISFSLLTILYVLNDFNSYYTENNDENKNDENIEIIKKIEKALYIILPLTILSGVFIYFIKQQKDKGKLWDTSKFIFGISKCSSMK